MRWFYYLILALLAVLLQSTVVQVLWFRTGSGWTGPDVVAAVAIFVGLSARTSLDAALAGWLAGMALDLTLTGGGMGLLGLLYAGACAAIVHLRHAMLRDKALTQFILGLLFCLFVYGPWMLYQQIISPASSLGSQALQVLGVALTTALLTPLVVAALKRVQRFLIPAGSARERM